VAISNPCTPYARPGLLRGATLAVLLILIVTTSCYAAVLYCPSTTTPYPEVYSSDLGAIPGSHWIVTVSSDIGGTGTNRANFLVCSDGSSLNMGLAIGATGACPDGVGAKMKCICSTSGGCLRRDFSAEWVQTPGPGPTGPQGEKGDTGDTGPQGIQGLKGDTGDVGPQGIQGFNGSTGDPGPQGDQGLKGDTGDIGSQGDQGIKGDTGDIGPQGDQGLKGDTGNIGPQGDQGLKGDTGDIGPQGDQGVKGDTGDIGPQGDQGLKGDTGDIGPQGAAAPGVESQYFSESYPKNTGIMLTVNPVLSTTVYVTHLDPPTTCTVEVLCDDIQVATLETEASAWTCPAGETMGLKCYNNGEALGDCTISSFYSAAVPGPQGIHGVDGEVGPQGEQGPPGYSGWIGGTVGGMVSGVVVVGTNYIIHKIKSYQRPLQPVPDRVPNPMRAVATWGWDAGNV
jgi:hypothetical protein